MLQRQSVVPRRIVRALVAASAMASLPAAAGIVVIGDVFENPSGGTVGVLAIGNSSTGSVGVSGGSSLTADQLFMGGTSNGVGSLTVSGTGSHTLVTFANGDGLGVGSQGTGDLSVLAGATFTYGGTGTPCQTNCRVWVSNGAGSNGSLSVSGAGSSFSTVGGIVVGNASVFTQAIGGFDFGIPGGASIGSAKVDTGGTINSSFLSVAQPSAGGASTGTESSSGSVIIDGASSVWNLVRNAAQTGAQALLRVAVGKNTSGAVEVRNGATLRLNGSSEADEYSGINVGTITSGATSSNGTGSIAVMGSGSRLEVNGGVGFMNVGRGNGMTGSVTVSDSGFVGGNGTETGLYFLTVGGGGGTGTAIVTGTGSLLRLNGRNSTTNSDPTSISAAGAFLSVGRGAGGSAGHGTMNVTAGGSVVIDTSALALTNVDGQTGMYVGAFNGSTGAVNVSGPGSKLMITAGSGMAPYVGIGRDSGTGSLTISDGGKVEVSSTHQSVPNLGATTYLPGDLNYFEIGRRVAGSGTGATSGTVTVMGVGSELAMSGAADSFIQVGIGDNATGTLNVLAAGTVRATAVLLGTDPGAIGLLNMNSGHMVIDGVLNGGPSAGAGGGVAVGRGGGSAVANISGGSTINISSTAPQAGFSLGGTSTSVGGTGTANISGGSALLVSGPQSLISVGRNGIASQMGIGTLILSGAGTSATVTGPGAAVLIAAGANTIGTAIVGAGSSLSATALIGVAHNGTDSTGGTGTLIVHGSANAAELKIGSGGLLGGTGVINANVTNFGILNGGESPGRLTINGAFDSDQGKIILEVQSLGNGLFAFDEIVFGDPSQVNIGAAAIEFHFLGDTDPEAFEATGGFNIGAFLQLADGSGGLEPMEPSVFAGVEFSASSSAYQITEFTYNPDTGGFAVTAVPEPGTWALMFGGLLLIAGAARRQVAT